DYTVTILPSAPNDIGCTAITAPSSGCNLTTTEQVTINVTNFGTNTQTAWNVHYRVNGGAVQTDPMTGSLASGQTVSHTFTNTTNMGTPGTYNIEAWTSLATDAVTFNDTNSTSVVAIPGVSTYPYIEDFESGNGGWLPGGNGSSWAFGTPNKNTINSAASGVNSYVTGGLGNGQYNANEDSHVLGPCFDFSTLQNPWISLSVWWNAEFSFDGMNLQYSTDFGVTWNNVGAFGDPGNWYTDNGIWGNPGGSMEGWSGRTISNNGSNGWLTAAHRLDGLAGVPSVRLRLTFGADGSIQDDGVAFDDIRIAEGPVTDIGPDTLLCGGDTIFLDGGNFTSYLWSNGPTSQIDTITTGGTYWVRVTDSLGFYDIDTITIGLSNPIVNVGPDSTICPGDTVVLDAGSHPGGTFLWTNADVNQTSQFFTAGVHGVTVTDSAGCMKSDSMLIQVAIPPMLNLGNDTTVCSSTPVVLDAGNGPVGTDYQWNSGATTQVIVITSPGVYAASVTTPGGCAAIDSLEVFNHPSPAVNLGPDRVECGPFTLDAGPNGASYTWSTSAGTQTINESTAGNYAVTVTNQFGCEAIDDVTISMGTVPTVNIGNDTVLCNNQSLTLNAGNPGATYFWSNGATTQSITVNNAAVYIVQVTNTDGCVGVDTIVIDNSNLAVSLGPDQNLCGNNGIILDAGNPGMTFNWSTNESTQQVTITSTGTYTVTVTDAQGCSTSDNITIGQNAVIIAGITAPANAALGQTVQFNDNSNPTPVSWDWAFGDGMSSTAQNPTHQYQALQMFMARLIVEDSDGCRDTTFHNIEVDQVIDVEDAFFAQALDIFPNPSSGLFHLYLELYKRKDLEVRVMDLNGRQVFNEAYRDVLIHRSDIDLAQFPKGVYFLHLRAGDRELFKKLVVQ
ncbi:MAG: PKD domain-containing protein, partial [Bacteroidota bacterium]